MFLNLNHHPVCAASDASHLLLTGAATPPGQEGRWPGRIVSISLLPCLADFLSDGSGVRLAACLPEPNTCRFVILGLAVSANAQISQTTKFSILGSLVATEGAARIPMPLGKSGVELSANGIINRDKLQKEIAENGQAILPGKVVSITADRFQRQIH